MKETYYQLRKKNWWTEATVKKKLHYVYNLFSQHLKYFSHIIKRASVTVTLRIPIQVFGSNLDGGQWLSFLRYLWFSSIPPDRFLPNPFQFIIHQSSCHSALYSLSYRQCRETTHTETLWYLYWYIKLHKTRRDKWKCNINTPSQISL
jgi:hypothetical protein